MTVTINGPANAASSGGGTGTVTHTAGALTANQVVIGNGTDDLKTLGSLGTTTTVLHGNAAGAPTYGAVAISTDVSGLGTGVATFLGTPTSANLAAALTDETGTGAAVFANTPTLVTPVIGAATGTSVALTGGAITDTQDVAATSTDGLVLATSATATSGNQKWSPRIRFRASGWGTTGGAAQTSDWIIENIPVQGATTNPRLVFSHSLAGAAYVPKIHFDMNFVNGYGGIFFTDGTYYAGMSGWTNGDVVLGSNASNYLRVSAFSATAAGDSGTVLSNSSIFGWALAGGATNLSDTMMCRAGAANIQFGRAAANPPIAQTLSVQDASGSNIAGAAWTFRESRATGTAKGGGFQWYLGATLGSGTTLQTAALALDLGVTTYHVLTFADAIDIAFNATTGTKIGTATTQKLGFYGATPIVQGASVADATGGVVIDAEARTAINALISRIEALGLIATV